MNGVRSHKGEPSLRIKLRRACLKRRTMANNIYRPVAYGLSDALLNVFPAPIVGLRNPTTADKAQIGSVWVNKVANDAWVLTSITNNMANWTGVGGGAGSFTSLTVAPGNITATNGNINATAGSMSAGTTITAGTGLIATTGGVTATAGNIVATAGNITASAGNIAATLGSVSAGTTVTAGTGITATTGNIVASTGNITATLGNIAASAGSVSASTTVSAGTAVSAGTSVSAGTTVTATTALLGATVRVSGDSGGLASNTSMTNVVDTAQSSGLLTILSDSVNPGTNAGFLKFYVGTVAVYVPYFTVIAP